jgi:hypothetical protein
VARFGTIVKSPEKGFPAPGCYISGTAVDSEAARQVAAGARPLWYVSVVNLNKFPVTIYEVGFGKVKRGKRSIIFEPESVPPNTWPEAVVYDDAIFAAVRKQEKIFRDARAVDGADLERYIGKGNAHN